MVVAQALQNTRLRRKSFWNFIKKLGYLSLKQLIQIGFHQALHDVDVSHLVNGSGSDDVPNVDDVFMAESREDLDFPQSSLAIGLVFKRTDFLYSHLCIGIRIKR